MGRTFRKKHDVPGDGNCLWYALAILIYGDIKKWELVRDAVLDFMLTKKNHFEDLLRQANMSYQSGDRDYSDFKSIARGH